MIDFPLFVAYLKISGRIRIPERVEYFILTMIWKTTTVSEATVL